MDLLPCDMGEAMMLLDNRYEEYEFASISADEIMRYAASIKNNYSEKQKERLYDIIDYLEKVFPEKDKMLKKINIPVVMLAAYTAMGKDYNSLKNVYRVGPMYFRQWFSYFFNECYDEYKQFCSSGSIKKEKTLKRIEIMEASLISYFELQDADKSDQTEQDTPEETSSDESNLQDESKLLTDADSSENDSSVNQEEGSDSEADGYASVAEDTTSSYATSEKASDEEEKPPEEVNQDTE